MAVTTEDLDQVFGNLAKLEKLFMREAKQFLQIEEPKGKIFTTDLYVSAIVNRAISLMLGFKTLAHQNNYICAVPLIRIQIDNCMRLLAVTLVKSEEAFFMEYLKGTHIRNIEDASGQKMTDHYLVTRLDKEVFPGIHNLYINTSGYIHLSNEHSFLQTELSKEEERTILTRIGHYDFFAIDEKVDFAFNMFKASEFLLTLVKSWRVEKARRLKVS